MAKIIQEDLWTPIPYPGMVVVTTNGSLRHNGSVVMGRGAAYQATQRMPGIDRECGYAIANSPLSVHYNGTYVYGFLVVHNPTGLGVKTGFGIFQVKYAWSDLADPGLIALSMHMLRLYATAHPAVQIRMNYPGIGNGGLHSSQVEPFLAWLPDNVTVCYQ